MQRVEVQENNFQFDQYYYFKQRKLLITPNQPIEMVFFMNSKLCSEIHLIQEI